MKEVASLEERLLDFFKLLIYDHIWSKQSTPGSVVPLTMFFCKLRTFNNIKEVLKNETKYTVRDTIKGLYARIYQKVEIWLSVTNS